MIRGSSAGDMIRGSSAGNMVRGKLRGGNSAKDAVGLPRNFKNKPTREDARPKNRCFLPVQSSMGVILRLRRAPTGLRRRSIVQGGGDSAFYK